MTDGGPTRASPTVEDEWRAYLPGTHPDPVGATVIRLGSADPAAAASR
jgi:hypothetical protein